VVFLANQVNVLPSAAEGLHDGTRPQVASGSFKEPGVQHTYH
jgi:hypothetical protein